MARIHVAFQRLKIVAIVIELGDVTMLGRNVEGLERRNQRRLSGAKISKNDPGFFLTRVGEVSDLMLEFVPRRFRRLLETRAPDIEKPPVIQTPNPPVFDSSHTEVGAPMGTVEAEEPGPSLIVTEKH